MSNFYLVVPLSPPHPDPVRRWPVVGRRTELAQIAAWLADAADGAHLRGVVLHGPAGIGKTALAARAASAAAALGFATERLVAGAGRDVPLMWLAPLRPRFSPAHSRMELLHELEVTIASRAADRPMLLVIDDVPLLEPADVDLIGYLARRGLVFVVATAREGQQGLNNFAPLFVDGTLTRIEVGPLQSSALVTAAAEFLGGPLHPTATNELRRVSHGVPLFAREFLATNLQRGMLTLDDGQWRLSPDASVPTSLLELIHARYLGLAPAQVRYLETLAVAQPLPLLFRPDSLTSGQLAELEDIGLITAESERGSVVVRLAHPLYAEALLAGAGSLRRSDIAERARAALDHLPIDNPDRELRIAALSAEYGLPLTDELAVSAAERALNALDPALAERLIARVQRHTWASEFCLGAALAARGHIAAANDVLHRAEMLADTDEQRARAISRRVNCLGTGGGRFQEALDVLSIASETLTDTHWKTFLDADRAYLLLGMGDSAPVRLESDATGKVRANECLVGAVIAALSGRGADAEALIDEGLSIVHHLVADVPTARELLNLSRFIVLATTGRTQEAAATVASELERSEGRSALAGSWLAMRALQSLLNGDAVAASTQAAHAAHVLAEVDISALRPMALGLQAAALAQLNRGDESSQVLATIDPAWRDETKARLMAEQASAWQLVMSGQSAAGAQRLARAAKSALDAQHAPIAMMAAHDACRFGHPSVALPVLREAASHVEGRLVQALLEHAVALDVGDHDQLLVSADELPLLGFTVSGAESAATAARLLDRIGRPTDAAHARAKASSLLAAIGDVRTPGLGNLVVLTAREREIANMAAQRMRSREIADALGISARTVDNHLVAVYRKLGVASRDELAQRLPSAV